MEKNNEAEAITITFKGEEYSAEIKPYDFFIVVYPEYKKIKEDTDIYNLYQQQESKDLKVELINSDGEINKEIKFLK